VLPVVPALFPVDPFELPVVPVLDPVDPEVGPM
jgi:hypothetical protein